MQSLKEKQLYAKFFKYEFWLDKATFLGHVVSTEVILVDQSKIKAVVDWQMPKRVKKVHSSLGLVGYYRRFIERFVKLARPFTTLTKKET